MFSADGNKRYPSDCFAVVTKQNTVVWMFATRCY